MPRPEFTAAQAIAVESIPRSGTIIYEGTIVGPNVGTIVGAAVIKTNILSIIDSITLAENGLSSANIVEAKIIGFGKKVGTIFGTNIGTVVADTNTVLVQLFQEGTVSVGGVLQEVQPAPGAQILGSITVVEIGR